MQDAVGLLREMPETARTLKSAHDILRHCVDAQRMDLAANLLDDMEGLGLRWNPWTWYLATCLQVTPSSAVYPTLHTAFYFCLSHIGSCLKRAAFA